MVVGAVRRSLALASTTLAVMLPPSSALAANGDKDRQPAVFTDVPCMLVVDRSTTSLVHIDYTIAKEDVGMTPDEVEDSRTHQFFAFAVQRLETQPAAAQPRYITWSDIERAALVDSAVDPATIDPQTVLETTSIFAADEWVRITADDMRVPITFAQAAMGVDWDVSDVRPGTWLVRGYTWEPAENLWSFRWGGVKVIASEEEHHEAGPSVILSDNPDQLLESGIANTVQGCVDAPEGSRLTLEYGVQEGTLAPESWVVFAEDCDVENGALDVVFVPPDALAGSTLYFRATITDTEGRAYAAYSPQALGVIQGPDTEGVSAEQAQAKCEDGEPDGCSCGAARSHAPWLLVFLLPCLRRRRREENLRP